MPNHDRITRSERTAPVSGSTLSSPKNRWRAAIISGSGADAFTAGAAQLVPPPTITTKPIAATMLTTERRIPRIRLSPDPSLHIHSKPEWGAVGHASPPASALLA